MTEFFFILDRNDPWKRISALSARNVAKRDSVDDEERGGPQDGALGHTRGTGQEACHRFGG